MDQLTKQIIETFLELRSASISIVDDPQPTMKKYGLLFFGSKFNKITTIEMYHALIKKQLNMPIENEDFQKMVPAICDMLSMKYESLQQIDAPLNSDASCYFVELW